MRRYLNFTRQEWEALPWHDAKLYREGLRREFARTEDEALDEEGFPEDDVPEGFEGDELDLLAGMGFQVRVVG